VRISPVALLEVVVAIILSVFAAGAARARPEIRYDRTDPGRTTPFPDDFWLAPDASTATGLRAEIPVPAREPDVQAIFQSLVNGTLACDGFSPVGGIAIELTDAPRESTLPRGAAASLEPLASIGLFDVTPGSPSLGERVPFQLRLKSMAFPGQALTHTLVIFPAVPLAPTHRYGLVVTRRLRSVAGMRFSPSAFFDAALGPPAAAEAPQIGRVRTLVADVIGAVGGAAPAFLADGVALVLRITARSTDAIPRDPLRMREQILARPPPAVSVTGAVPGFGPVAAIVSGTWEAPTWLDGSFLARDPAGDPVVTGTQTIGFTLALPQAALGPAPVTIVLHGGGGSAEADVPSVAGAAGLAQAGIATLGFTGYFSREIGLDQDAQNLAMFAALYLEGRIPDFWSEVLGEQLAFLRATGQLSTLDVLPLGQPDGTPDLDLAAPLTLVGYSAGSIEAQGLVAYAPELRAAALVAGSARFTEQWVHQDDTGNTTFFRTVLPTFLPQLTPPDLWSGAAIFQMGFDRQDLHNHAAFLYRQPLAELGTLRRASLLVIEGLHDFAIPNSATRSLAWTAGPIPQLEPVAEEVPFLETVQGPVTANIDDQTTAAFFQYVPAGIPGLDPSVGCEFEPEGHYCAQSASSSRAQVLRFLKTALSQPAPTVSVSVPEPCQGLLVLTGGLALLGVRRRQKAGGSARAFIGRAARAGRGR